MEKKLKICLICAIVLGAVLLIVGLVLGFAVFPSEVEKQIKENTELVKGTKQWDRFVELPIPLTFKVYLFEVTNEKEFLAGTEKPKLKERGPYVYSEDRKKNILDDSGDYVTYEEIQNFHFDAAASAPLTPLDSINILNIAYLATLQISEGLSNDLSQLFDFEDVLNCMFRRRDAHDMQKVFIQNSVQSVLFKGIDFCIEGDIARNVGARIYCMAVTILNLKNIKSEKDHKVFSYLGFKDNASSGVWKVNTGTNDYKQLGEIVEWENSSTTHFWKPEPETCNKVEGRDSTIFPPLLSKDDTFTIFSNDICRKVGMSFIAESEYKDIKGYRYESDETMLTEPDPENSCYCIQKTKNEKGKPSCFLDGVLDLYTCYGAPILASYPHFLFADKYQRMVENLEPDVQKHSSYADLEPNTGTPLRGVKRIQFNIVLRKFIVQETPVEDTKNIDNGAVIPTIWVEEGVELNDELINELNDSYFDIIVILDAVQWTLIAVGAALFVLSGGFFIYKAKTS